eukprot:109054-Pelagomonas_calceolata.AAC.1
MEVQVVQEQRKISVSALLKPMVVCKPYQPETAQPYCCNSNGLLRLELLASRRVSSWTLTALLF